ncbi:hypothetical protein IFM89_001747 [Coptis chinensis]|uniref:Uncharacterized protein n=1 Tax=Coptis chinensis TaxID=261450 RepID=A0A835LUA9_9MAGN|nr:hypothetical protein IFM89_001747 [Coptis chinensis]
MFVPTTLQCQQEKKDGSPEKKKTNRVRKGWIAVRVGLEKEEGGFQTFSIPISDLCHPLYGDLLEKSQEMYGSNKEGLLRLPCSVEEFENLRLRVEQESICPQYLHQPQLRYLA